MEPIQSNTTNPLKDLYKQTLTHIKKNEIDLCLPAILYSTFTQKNIHSLIEHSWKIISETFTSIEEKLAKETLSVEDVLEKFPALKLCSLVMISARRIIEEDCYYIVENDNYKISHFHIDYENNQGDPNDLYSAIVLFAITQKAYGLANLFIDKFPGRININQNTPFSFRGINQDSSAGYCFENKNWVLLKKMTLLNSKYLDVKFQNKITNAINNSWINRYNEEEKNLLHTIDLCMDLELQNNSKLVDEFKPIYEAFFDEWNHPNCLPLDYSPLITRSAIPKTQDIPDHLLMSFMKMIKNEEIGKLQAKAKNTIAVLGFKNYRWEQGKLDHAWTKSQIKDHHNLIQTCLDEVCKNEILLRRDLRFKIIEGLSNISVFNKKNVKKAIEAALIPSLENGNN